MKRHVAKHPVVRALGGASESEDVALEFSEPSVHGIGLVRGKLFGGVATRGDTMDGGKLTVARGFNVKG